MLRDIEQRPYQGILYSQNVAKFHGTCLSAISVQEPLAQPIDTASHIPEISVLRRTDVETQKLAQNFQFVSVRIGCTAAMSCISISDDCRRNGQNW